MKRPEIRTGELENQAMPSEGVISFELSHFKDQDLGEAQIDELRLEECLIGGANLDHAKIEECKFVDCIFDRCSFVSAKIKEPFTLRVEIKNSRMQGMQADSGILTDTHFKSCKIQAANFRYARFKDAVFEDCDLSDADFTSAQLERVAFKSCNLGAVQFSQAKMHEVRISGSTIENIHLGPDSLKGLIVDTGQALYLSSIFGLKIED